MRYVRRRHAISLFYGDPGVGKSVAGQAIADSFAPGAGCVVNLTTRPNPSLLANLILEWLPEHVALQSLLREGVLRADPGPDADRPSAGRVLRSRPRPQRTPIPRRSMTTRPRSARCMHCKPVLPGSLRRKP